VEGYSNVTPLPEYTFHASSVAVGVIAAALAPAVINQHRALTDDYKINIS
jgi:hypothetical protein